MMPKKDLTKKLVNTGGVMTEPELNQAIKENLEKHHPVHGAFGHVFEKIGGVDRMARWANDEPGKFYAIFARMAPQETSQNQINIQINAKLGPGPLDE